MATTNFSPNVSKLNNARLSILLTVIFSAVNIILANFGIYLIYSSYFSTLIVNVGVVMKVESGMDIYFIVAAVLALISLVPYLLSWIFSKKHPVWLVICLVLFALDTIFVTFDSMVLIAEGDYSIVLDLILHVIILIELIVGVKAGFALKKEANALNAEPYSAEPLINEVENPLANVTREITITRVKSFIGAAMAYHIFVNGELVGNLTNGETKTLTVPANEFELAIAISNGLASNRITVEEGVENANYNVQTKMGFTNNNIIISKVEN